MTGQTVSPLDPTDRTYSALGHIFGLTEALTDLAYNHGALNGKDPRARATLALIAVIAEKVDEAEAGFKAMLEKTARPA